MRPVWQNDSEQLVLPFSERDWIDMDHAQHILGASWSTVYRLFLAKEIQILDYRKRAWKRVHYGSIVEFCDRLRFKYAIPDRKPKLAAGFLRYRDEDVLPFPLRDTIAAADVMRALSLTRMQPLEALVDEGQVEGYQLISGGVWRISRASLQAYMQAIRHPMLSR